MKFVREIRLLYHSVRHVPARQLLARLRLMARRQWRWRLGPPRSFQSPMPHRTDRLPVPLFPPREHLVVRRADAITLDLLNLEVPWGEGIDWHPPVSKDWTHLRRFHLHYMEYCEGFGDADFMVAVESWIGRNPAYTGGYWYDSWSSYVISLRTAVWMQQIAARPDLPPDFVDRASASIVQQMRVLIDHLELDIRGNHLVKNAKALVWAGVFFDGPEAAVWRRRGEQLLAEIISEQILPDGMHYELSASYHAQVFADLLECAQVLPDSDVRERLLQVFPQMGHALVCMTHPDGLPALFNDAGLAMAYPAAQVLAAARRYIGEIAAPQGGFSLPDAGYYGFRRDGDYLLVKAGKIGPDALPAHAHADLLSFEWDVDGQRVIVDPGVSEYEAGPMRDYARRTAAHNTLTIDGLDQAEMWGAFRVGRRGRARVSEWAAAEDHFRLVAAHDGYGRLAGHPMHHREITMSSDGLSVEDQIRSSVPVVGDGGFLLHPDCEVSAGERGVVLRRENVSIESDSAATPDAARWLPGMGDIRATRRLLMRESVGATALTHSFKVRSRA